MKLSFLVLLLSTTAYALGTEPGIPNLDQPERLGAVQPLKKADEARRLSQENALKISVEDRTSLRLQVKNAIDKAIENGDTKTNINVANHSSVNIDKQITELQQNGYVVNLKFIENAWTHYLQVSW